MKRSDLSAVTQYMYKDELQSFEEHLLDNDLLPESELVNGRIPIAKLAEVARERRTGHIFESVQAIADFVDEE